MFLFSHVEITILFYEIEFSFVDNFGRWMLKEFNRLNGSKVVFKLKAGKLRLDSKG